METKEESKKTLMELVSDASRIMAILSENGGELSPELEAMFDMVGQDLALKTDGYAFLMDRLDAEEKFWAERAAQFNRVSKSCGALREHLKDRIKGAMLQMNTDEIAGGDFRFKLSNAKPRMVVEGSHLPEEWLMVVTEKVPDKERIRAALEAGQTVPGAWLEESKALRKYVNTKKGK